MTKPLEEAERRLAEVTACLIAKAEEMKLPDTPDKLGVTAQAIQLLARAHVELLDQARVLRDRIDQIARVAIEGAIREIARQQGGIATGQIIDEAKSEGMLAAQPFISVLPRPSASEEKPASGGFLRLEPCASRDDGAFVRRCLKDYAREQAAQKALR
jgi:hypothetical protein